MSRILLWDGDGWTEKGKRTPKGISHLARGDQYESDTQDGLRSMQVEETLSDMGLVIVRAVEIPKGGKKP